MAVAAPVRRDGGAVVAALSVSGPATRLTPATLPGVAAQCVAQADALSACPRPPADGAAAATAGAPAG